MLDPFKEIETEYASNYHFMYKFLLKLTKDHEKAHDIIQDVFMTILKNPTILSNVNNRNAWFIKLAKNKYIDHLRKKTETLVEEDYFFSSLKSTHSVENKVTQSEAIEEVLSLLTPEDRDYVLAKYYYGFNYKEISAITGKSTSFIRLRVFRAKKLILERMNMDE